MSVSEDTLAMARMDDDGFGCAITTTTDTPAWFMREDTGTIQFTDSTL
jgi:hypothetical protein